MRSNTNQFENWWDTKIGSEILRKKYMHEGETESYDVSARLAGIFSSDKLHDDMIDAFHNADFFPGGRSIYGAGSKGKFKASMSNCYICPMPNDNIEDIFEVAKKTARIFSYGGGVGINISNLRPSGAVVNNAARTSTGAVSFMQIFDSVGNVIGANNRRAALILGLNCDHPDIEEFLTIKQNNTAIQSANISILFTNEFMQAVQSGDNFELRFVVESTGEVIKKTINARDFFMEFAKVNHDWAEPGCLFIDRIRSYNLLAGYPKELYKIDISNPCAEYVGNAYNSCNLGSLNLYNVVDDPFTPQAKINYEKLASFIKLGVEALDEILDYGAEMQPLQENKDCIHDWRAIGLGVFGLADMLVALGVKYGSHASCNLVDAVMRFVMNEAVKASAELARTKGTFGKYDYKYVSKSPILKALPVETQKLVEKYGLRNGSLLSIAPTGTISTMCGVSGGVEPIFAISYERTTHALSNKNHFFKVYAKSVEALLRFNGIDPQQITDEEIKARFPFVVASHDIDPLDRVRVQAAMQKWVDNAISSTVNLKEEATVQDVFDTYLLAWQLGCKGLTIFRNGCARNAILVTKKNEDEPKIESESNSASMVKFNSISPVKRGNINRVDGSTIVRHTACVPNLYTTVNNLNGNIFEVFTNVSSGCRSNINTITRLVSLALRSGVKVEEVIAELKANVCPACSVLKQQGRKEIASSCGGSIGEAIEEVYKTLQNKQAALVVEVPLVHSADQIENGLLPCPQCNEKTLRPEGRCFNCSSCGYSKCE